MMVETDISFTTSVSVGPLKIHVKQQNVRGDIQLINKSGMEV